MSRKKKNYYYNVYRGAELVHEELTEEEFMDKMEWYAHEYYMNESGRWWFEMVLKIFACTEIKYERMLKYSVRFVMYTRDTGDTAQSRRVGTARDNSVV